MTGETIYRAPNVDDIKLFLIGLDVLFRQSQVELRNQIEILSAELQSISQNQQCPVDLDVYVKKLLEARRRITIVNSILQNAQVYSSNIRTLLHYLCNLILSSLQDRLNKVHQLSAKEIAKINPASVNPVNNG